MTGLFHGVRRGRVWKSGAEGERKFSRTRSRRGVAGRARSDVNARTLSRRMKTPAALLSSALLAALPLGAAAQNIPTPAGEILSTIPARGAE